MKFRTPAYVGLTLFAFAGALYVTRTPSVAAQNKRRSSGADLRSGSVLAEAAAEPLGARARRSACRWMPRITSGSSIGRRPSKTTSRPPTSRSATVPIGVVLRRSRRPVSGIRSRRRETWSAHLGRSRPGLRVAGEQSRHHRRSQGQRLDWRQRRHGHADPEVRQATGSSSCRSASRASTTAATTWRTSGGPRRSIEDPAANEMYIADGYGNRRVIVFDARDRQVQAALGRVRQQAERRQACRRTTRRRRRRSSSTPCTAPIVSNDGFVYVCDRVNDRIQVFRKDGTFVKEAFIDKNTLRSGSVWDMTFSRDPQQTYIYMANGVDEKISIVLREHARSADVASATAAARPGPVLRRPQPGHRFEGQPLRHRNLHRRARAAVPLQRRRAGDEGRRRACSGQQ